jgi:hypothetical protein
LTTSYLLNRRNGSSGTGRALGVFLRKKQREARFLLNKSLGNDVLLVIVGGSSVHRGRLEGIKRNTSNLHCGKSLNCQRRVTQLQ